MRRKLIAGNWKMNKTVTESLALARELRGLVSMVRHVDIAVAPTFPALHPVAKALEDSNIQVAGQHCHAEASGGAEPWASLCRLWAAGYAPLGVCGGTLFVWALPVAGGAS